MQEAGGAGEESDEWRKETFSVTRHVIKFLIALVALIYD